MGQLFLIAIRNLAQHRKRTLLLGGAIAGVSALLVFLICLSSGIHSAMLESATTLGTGHLNVGGFYKVTAGQSSPVITKYEELAKIVQQTVPNDLDFVSPRGRGWAKMVSDTGSMQVAIGGLDIDKEPTFRRVVQALEGKIEDLNQPGTIVIFEAQAKKLGLKVGDMVVLSSETARGVNNTVDVRVAAVARDFGLMSQWNIFVPSDTVRELAQINKESTGALHIYLKDIGRIPQVMDALRKAYTEAGYILMDREAKAFWMKFESVNREDWTGQKLDLTTWEEEMSFFQWMLTGIDGLMVILSAVLLVIIAVGIMNSMWIAIRERTREIGTLRAIGMQRRRVLAMFLIEAFTLGALGTLLGASLGLLGAALLNLLSLPVPQGAQMFLMSATVKTSIDFAKILAGMTIITGCTTVIAVIPSIHAARMKPITAMQHIG